VDPKTEAPVELSEEESAEELYELAPCGYLTTTLDGRIFKVNKTLLEWLGYEREELVGRKRLTDLLTVGGKIFFETHFNLLLRVQRSVDEIALDLIRKDGQVLPALINARQKRNAADEPVLNRFTIFNSSERRMYERQLLAARDLLRTTLSSIGDAVAATDTEGQITFMNPVAEELSGWKEDAALGRPIDDILVFVREDNSEPVENPTAHALRTGVVTGLENHTVLVSRDGRQLPIDDSASPIRDGSGNVVGAVLVFRDISERRRAEKELQEAHRQLENRAAELRRSNEDLTQFAQVASHDLRSPLNTIIQLAQLLESIYGERLGDGKELLSHLTGAAKRMARLIHDLLAYARIARDVTHPLRPVDANIPLQMAIDNLRSSIQRSGATVTHERLPVVGVDSTSLIQLFQNLIGNAIHYRGEQAPVIHVAAAEQGEDWRFSCTDNGIGIAPQDHARIFQPFERLHESERSGSGIGLAVCKRIVERYRGRIWVESQLGQGATFFFTIPKT
jgi:PAS domain S-box-containing protein